MTGSEKQDDLPSGLADLWRRIGEALQLEITAPATVAVASGATLRVDAVVAHYGGQRGTVVVADAAQLGSHRQELLEAGYGYSVWSPVDVDAPVNVDVAMSILRDWEWYGPPGDEPAWYRRDP